MNYTLMPEGCNTLQSDFNSNSLQQLLVATILHSPHCAFD